MFSNDDLVSLTLTCTVLKILQDILVKNLLKWSVKEFGGGGGRIEAITEHDHD